MYFGIYGNNRNPGDEKMAKKRKNALCVKTKLIGWWFGAWLDYGFPYILNFIIPTDL